MVGVLMPSSPPSGLSDEGSRPNKVLSVDSSGYEASSSASSEGSVTLERNGDGHFYADARVNGAPIHFLVDTGATGVALARNDAQRAGIPYSLSESEVIGRGASGDVRGQQVSLERISLGHKEAEDLPAVILEGSEQSLLGQDFLRRFGSVSIEDDRMVLR